MRMQIRRGSRAGALPPVIAIRRLARTGRARWRPAFLLAGVLLIAVGLVLPSVVVLMAGLILLGSAATAEWSPAGLLTPTAAMVREWMPRKRPDHLKRMPAESLPKHFGSP